MKRSIKLVLFSFTLLSCTLVGVLYYASTLKRESASKNDQLRGISNQLKSKDAHIAKLLQAYQKTVDQKKELKVVFKKEYDKIVVKFKELANPFC